MPLIYSSQTLNWNKIKRLHQRSTGDINKDKFRFKKRVKISRNMTQEESQRPLRSSSQNQSFRPQNEKRNQSRISIKLKRAKKKNPIPKNLFLRKKTNDAMRRKQPKAKQILEIRIKGKKSTRNYQICGDSYATTSIGMEKSVRGERN